MRWLVAFVLFYGVSSRAQTREYQPTIFDDASGAKWEDLWSKLHQNPQAIHTKDGMGRNVLHHAISTQSDENVLKLVALAPSLLLDQDYTKTLPLHEAIHLLNPETTLELLEAAPSAASVANDIGRLPLHIAAGWSRHPQTKLIARLIALYPQAARMEDAYQKIPLQIAIATDYERAFWIAIHTPTDLLQEHLPSVLAIMNPSNPNGRTLKEKNRILTMLDDFLRLGSVDDQDLGEWLTFFLALDHFSTQNSVTLDSFKSPKYLVALLEIYKHTLGSYSRYEENIFEPIDYLNTNSYANRISAAPKLFRRYRNLLSRSILQSVTTPQNLDTPSILDVIYIFMHHSERSLQTKSDLAKETKTNLEHTLSQLKLLLKDLQDDERFSQGIHSRNIKFKNSDFTEIFENFKVYASQAAKEAS